MKVCSFALDLVSESSYGSEMRTFELPTMGLGLEITEFRIPLYVTRHTISGGRYGDYSNHNNNMQIHGSF